VVLDLKRLLVFTEVARRSSVSAAAAALSYTQPAISHHVAQLEAQVGAPLFERTPQGMRLTPVGLTLQEHADRVLAALDSADAALADMLGRSAALVRLGAFASANASFVSDALATQRRAVPEIRLTLLTGEAAEVLAALRERRIDIGVVFDHPSAPVVAPDLEFTTVAHDPMLLALPDTHPLAGRARVSLHELSDEPWIEGAGADTPASLILLGAAGMAGFQPRVAFNSGDYQVVLRLVGAGFGVALVPGLAVRAPEPGVAVREVAGDPPIRRIALVTRRDVHQSPLVRSMLDQLAHHACQVTGSMTPARESVA
jgi:DNA-binding transcriptional LysR family regulator